VRLKNSPFRTTFAFSFASHHIGDIPSNQWVRGCPSQIS
jgi:hypothetical protein